MRDIDIAKKRLIEEDFTCVLCMGDSEYNSRAHGVKPLIDFFDSGDSFVGFSAADRVVGAGAAYLYVLLGVKEVWAGVISKSAVNILLTNDMNVTFDSLVPEIRDRTGEGFCPIEQAVKNASCATEALTSIRKTLSVLLQNKR